MSKNTSKQHLAVYPDSVRVAKILGGNVSQSHVVHGMVILRGAEKTLTSMDDASEMAAHSHGGGEHEMNMYSGPLDFQMLNASIAYFGEKWEVLNEFSFNRTKTDTLGVSNNISNYTYVGRRFLEKNVAFTGFDVLYTGENDLLTYPYDRMKFILGYKYEYSERLNVKAQIEYYTNIYDDHSHDHSIGSKYEFKIQMSYGL